MKWYLIDDIEVMPECLPKIKTGILHSHNSLSRQYYDYIQRENGKNPVQQKLGSCKTTGTQKHTR